MPSQVRESDRRVGFAEVTTLNDSVEMAASRWEHDALVFPGERATYRELADRIDHFARGLMGLGVGVGDKVGVLTTQGVDYFATLVGAAKVGAIGVPINSRYKATELRHIIVNSEMTVLCTTTLLDGHLDVPALLEEALPSLADATDTHLGLGEAPDLRHIILLEDGRRTGYIARARFDEAGDDIGDDEILLRRAAVRVRDTAIIMYTSGTTAAPKGAMLSHEGLVRVGVTVGRTRFNLTSSDRMWTALPLYHIGGIAFAFACFGVGATYVHTGFFRPEVALAQLAEERCTIAIPAFETIWMAILDLPELPRTDLSALRLVFNIGLRERLIEMQQRLPDAIQVSGFGATESSSFVAVGDVDDSLEERVTTCGRPLPGLAVRIVNPDTGLDLPPGDVGEIVYRGWSTFLGYYNDPERTAASMDADGYFHSGDLGSLDEDGRLRFVSRLKDMLKVGGENVAAAEVEGHLVTHPAVLFAQVVSAPDARYTEVPAAFIQLKPGSETDEQDIIDHCLGRIATFKVPRYVRFVDEWPMSGTKIKKHLLRDQIADELAEAGITEAPKMRAGGTAT
jgi:fatty-acyl-CoA synthase